MPGASAAHAAPYGLAPGSSLRAVAVETLPVPRSPLILSCSVWTKTELCSQMVRRKVTPAGHCRHLSACLWRSKAL